MESEQMFWKQSSSESRILHFFVQCNTKSHTGLHAFVTQACFFSNLLQFACSSLRTVNIYFRNKNRSPLKDSREADATDTRSILTVQYLTFLNVWGVFYSLPHCICFIRSPCICPVYILAKNRNYLIGYMFPKRSPPFLFFLF